MNLQITNGSKLEASSSSFYDTFFIGEQSPPALGISLIHAIDFCHLFMSYNPSVVFESWHLREETFITCNSYPPIESNWANASVW